MKKGIFILLIFFWAIPAGFAQLKSYSFEEAEKLNTTNPKPFVIFIHTSWCNYCKLMENTTFKDPAIVAFLNQNFYFISLDAESKNDIIFNDHTFKFKPSGQNTGIHELAIELATINNEISYPTITVLGSNLTILLQTGSYKDPKTLYSLLKKLEYPH